MGQKTVGNVRWGVLVSYFLAVPEWDGHSRLPDVSQMSGEQVGVEPRDMGRTVLLFLK